MNDQTLQKIERRAQLVMAASQLVWLDRKTAAAYIGIGRTHLDELSPSLKPSKLGRRKIYSRQRIDQYLNLCAGIKPPLKEAISRYSQKKSAEENLS